MAGWDTETKHNASEKGQPYWFSYNEDDKHIRASVEIGGLQFVGVMEEAE